ncbi:MAG: SusD/RagB family nutrient-binding outer membrane lipoprotein [Draconibacterium sp.]|nr:SusD/RagB family nutrient-binding outer membrane lipoprotein [Draconibacterium sp.]
MKKYIYNIFKSAGLVLLLAITITSCDTWIDTDLNIDPDAPADVPMNLMLPAIEQSLGFNLAGNDVVRVTNIWMQQFDGVDRQSYTQARYQLLPADVNNVWNSIYPEIFMNSIVLIDKAENTEGKESPHNAGVAKVIMATTLGVATDLFGDMPFSDAFKGNENVLTPTFDSQETLYSTIGSYLDAAIADLSSSENAVGVSGDVVYGGDVDLWKKAAYSIKARHLLQLTGINGSAAYSAALAAAGNGFSSIDDDFEVPWETDNKNPIFQFMEQRTDIRMGATLVDLMKNIDDPRLPFYAAEDADGNYTGSDILTQNGDASYPGDYIAAADAPSVIMSFAELKFIEAEAHLGLGDATKAKAAFEEGIKASVTKVVGEFDQDWYDTNFGGLTITLELIMEQKYIVSFGTNQAFADYRRTGLPALTIPEDANLPTMPTRFPYSQGEIDYNRKNVPSVTISDKLWWDK